MFVRGLFRIWKEKKKKRIWKAFYILFLLLFFLKNCYILIVNNPVTVGSLFESISWPTWMIFSINYRYKKKKLVSTLVIQWIICWSRTPPLSIHELKAYLLTDNSWRWLIHSISLNMSAKWDIEMSFIERHIFSLYFLPFLLSSKSKTK